MSNVTAGQVFVSYVRQDASVADRVVAALEEIGLRPWIDRKEIQPGDSFIDKMNQGLGKAAYVIVLLSAASLASRWVSREWMSALASAETVVVPLLLENCELPPLLRDIMYIDLRSDKEGGLRELRNFFVREQSPLTGAGLPSFGAARSPTVLLSSSRRILRLVALRCMRESEFRGILFDLERGPGAVPGDSLHERITNLLVWIATDGELDYFIKWLSTEPNCVRCVEKEVQRLNDEVAQ